MKKGGFVSGMAVAVAVMSSILLPSIAMAKVHIVGDDKGWGAGVDYQAWAANKFFAVGDVLVFKYAAGKDHVYQVDGPSFHSCSIPASGGLSSGNDVVMLISSGRKWFIGDHCMGGQKFVITVFSAGFPSSLPRPAPSPSSWWVSRKKPSSYFLP